MTFHVIDPLGYRLPYTQRDFRVMRRGAAAKPLEDPTERLPLQWPKEEKEKQGSGRDTWEHVFSVATERRLIPGPLLAKQVMTQKVKSIQADTLIRDAWEIMAKNRFRHLPILKDEKLIGIISDRRLAREMINRLYKKEKNLDIPIEEVMVTPVLTASPNTPVSEVAAMFLRERIGGMPIVDSEGKLLGILTRSDVLRTLAR